MKSILTSSATIIDKCYNNPMYKSYRIASKCPNCFNYLYDIEFGLTAQHAIMESEGSMNRNYCPFCGIQLKDEVPTLGWLKRFSEGKENG